MRFLPILLPISMLAPIAVWVALQIFVVKGSGATWMYGHKWELGLGVLATLIVSSLITRFISRGMRKSKASR